MVKGDVMVSTARILVVEDEANIRSLLQDMLVRDGYQVESVESGEAALSSISTQVFDMALIDLKLPGIGGIELMSALRQQLPEIVVIVLTAHASLETAVEALRQGAHDYLFKPCKSVELLESVRRGLVKRRSEIRKQDLLSQLDSLTNSLEDIRATMTDEHDAKAVDVAQPPSTQKRFLQGGALVIDLLHHVITLDGYQVEVSRTEFDLMVYMLNQAPRVVPPQELIREVQGYDSEQWEASDTVRSHIYHIRQKIKDATGRTDIIRTVRGVGYTIGE
jgi:DNA-binding response OmpR family regulator